MSRRHWLRFGLFNAMMGVCAYLLFDHAAGLWSFGLMGATIALVAPFPVSNQVLRWAGGILLGVGVFALGAVAYDHALKVIVVGTAIMLVSFSGKTVSDARSEPTKP